MYFDDKKKVVGGKSMSMHKSTTSPAELVPSTRSFKVITECPLIVMFLFQLYPQYIQTNIQLLLPLMIQCISSQGPKECPQGQLKQVFTDMKGAQIKTVSFLTYLLRSFGDLIKPHQHSISKAIIELMISTPDNVAIRKELLVATRHVLATDFRRGFFTHIDTLLNEEILIGKGRACYDTLRPLAYSLLAELIHHVRSDLTLKQLSAVVYIFSRNVHDDQLPLGVQMTCIRLMLNLVEVIFLSYAKRQEPAGKKEARALLGRILDTFIMKFHSLSYLVPDLIEKRRRSFVRINSEKSDLEVKNLPSKGHTDYQKEVHECKQLLKTLVMGLKTLLWSISHFARAHQQVQSQQAQAPAAVPNLPQSMTDDEVLAASTLLSNGVRCLYIFAETDGENNPADPPEPLSANNVGKLHPLASGNDILEHFFAVFTVLTPRNFLDMLHLGFDDFFRELVKLPILLNVVMHLLQNARLSRFLVDHLLEYLCNASRFETLKDLTNSEGILTLRLFQLCFGAVSKYPEADSSVQLKLIPLLERCLHFATDVENPKGYLQVLRTMFRALAGGKHESLYRELIPSLPGTIQSLCGLLEGPHGVRFRDQLVELFLILPARLSSLLPHLSRLILPLVLAVEGPQELVQLGLRTLEFWVDSLNPEFLEPVMRKYESRLLLALWQHLKPHPYPFGARTAQLLGKLGGRNRRFLRDPFDLECKESPEHGLRLVLTFAPSTSFLVPLDGCIGLAETVLGIKKKDPRGPPILYSTQYKSQAQRFLCICLASLLNVRGTGANASTFSKKNLLHALSEKESLLTQPSLPGKSDVGVKTKNQLIAERKMFQRLIEDVMLAESDDGLKGKCGDYCANLCRHFALLYSIGLPASNYLQCSQLDVPNEDTEAEVHTELRSTLKTLELHSFIEALVAVICRSEPDQSSFGLEMLVVFVDSINALCEARNCPSEHPADVGVLGMQPIPLPLKELFSLLMHCCYGHTWSQKIGGVAGLRIMMRKVSKDFVKPDLPKIVHCLCYCLNTLPQSALVHVEQTEETLCNLVRESTTEPDACLKEGPMHDIVEVLSKLLFSPSTGQTLRKCLENLTMVISSTFQVTPPDLLKNSASKALAALSSRALRKRPLEMQVQIVASIRFILAMQPQVVHELSPDVVSIVQEVLLICDSEEGKVKALNGKSQQTFARLRVECLRLALAVLSFPQWHSAGEPFAEMRVKVISSFFKNLTSHSEEMVEISSRGIQKVIQLQSLPKELLQSSLRPILLNLAHYKNLNLPLLRGLSKLLELLSNWFNITLGERLLEHLKRWLEPEKLALAPKSWKAGEENMVAAAIIDIFHLLPPAAVKFLETTKDSPGLVVLTIQLEAALPVTGLDSEISSPFRKPLTKFLNKYAPQSIDYFLARMANPAYFSRLISIIRSKEGAPLLEELSRNPDKIINAAFKPSFSSVQGGMQKHGTSKDSKQSGRNSATVTATQYSPEFQGVHLVSVIVELLPDWLPKQKQLLNILLAIWNSEDFKLRLREEENLSNTQLKEPKWLAQIFLSYFRRVRDDFSVLFHLLSIFTVRTQLDYSFLRAFFSEELPSTFSMSEKRRVLDHYLAMFEARPIQQEKLTAATSVLIAPMLSWSFENDTLEDRQKLLDEVAVQSIVANLLDPPEEVSESFEEPLRIELLQLATLLIRKASEELVSHRKELIKFGWNHLKREDSNCKQWAFVNVCHFLDAYQAPEKIILQVLVALLRTCQPESRTLVKEALDVLVPALPKRLPATDHKHPIWIRYAKKILVEEGHSLPHLVHIWQLVVRHASLFYTCRAQFVPQMVNSLSRLGLPQNSPQDNRKLSLDLAHLVVSWEQKRRKCSSMNGSSSAYASGGGEQKHPRDEDGDDKFDQGTPQKLQRIDESGLAVSMAVDAPDEASKTVEDDFQPTKPMEDMVVNFLVRMLFLSCDGKETDSSALYQFALLIFKEAMEMWPTTTIKLSYLDKLLGPALEQKAEKNPPALTAALDILSVLVKFQPKQLIRENSKHIVQVFDPCFRMVQGPECVLFCEIVSTMFDSYPPSSPTNSNDAKLLHAKLDELLKKYLSNAASGQVASGSQAISTPGVSCALSLLECLCKKHLTFVERFNQSLVMAANRYAREHAATGNSNQARVQAQKLRAKKMKCTDSGEFGSTSYNVRKCLCVASQVALKQSEQKKVFLQSLVLIITDRTSDGVILYEVLRVIDGWVQAQADSLRTMKAAQLQAQSGTGGISPKETILLLQRLAQLERTGATSAVAHEWEKIYLEMILLLCEEENGEMSAFGKEVFSKVEQLFLLGLRARDATIREKFFALYHKSIGQNLYLRLRYIVAMQDWEAMSDRFWLKQGIDLLLAILVENEQISAAPNSAQVPAIPGVCLEEDQARSADDVHREDHDQQNEKSGGSVTKESQLPEKEYLAESSGICPGKDEVVEKVSLFLNELSQYRVKDLIFPLRELAHIDGQVAYHLWVLVFPIVWATLSKEQQISLAKPIIGLLSKEYHHRQAHKRPNVVQALLEGISLSQPQPKIPSELIRFLGRTYNAWHVAIPLLESHVMLFPQEVRCFDGLAELYRHLDEKDMLVGLWKKKCVSNSTKLGLSLMQHGRWERAQSVFFKSLTQSDSVQSSTIPKAEVCLWEEQWIECAKQLNQWELLTEFGHSVDHSTLLLDCLWKVPHSWNVLKDKVLPKVGFEDSPEFLIVKAYTLLNDGSMQDAEVRANQGMQVALHKWWQLPDLSSCSRTPLLHLFQQLVELHESCRVLVDTAPGNQQQSYAELKDIMETWRLRTPNEWDDLLWWNNLMHWRNHVYGNVITAFDGFQEVSPQLHQLGYRDKAWSVNKLASIARKQMHGEVCVSVLNKMYGFSTMEVQEAFVKIREQCNAYLEMPGELVSGLNLINTSNLEYFQVQHKAELFRLKGIFYEKMGENDSANQSFGISVGLCTQLPEGWMSWAKYCDYMYKDSGNLQFLEQCTICYLQAVRHGSSNKGAAIGRVLQLLSFSNQNGSVGQAFDKYSELPLWVWLVWIPQLLYSLQRPEAKHVKPVLIQLSHMFPQALYYSLRAFLLERRESAVQVQRQSDQGKGNSGHASPTQKGQSQGTDAQGSLLQGSFEHAKEVMEHLRSRYSSLVSELEVFLSELGSRFVPSPEERLLAVVHALLQRCFKYTTSVDSEVPSTLKRELAGVCKACFSSETVSKHAQFYEHYREAFLKALDPGKDLFPVHVQELIRRLKVWVHILHYNIEQKVSSPLMLENESPALLELHPMEIEMPGQYLGDCEIASESMVKLECVDPSVHVVRRHGSSNRRVCLVGSDGSLKHFLVQTSLSIAARSDERMLQLMRMINGFLTQCKNSRQRSLAFYAPVIVPLWPQVRLLEDEEFSTTFGEAYEINCGRYGREPDSPIMRFKTVFNEAKTRLLDENDALLEAFSTINKEVISENIFSQFVYKTLPSCNHLWTFKKQFCSQLAITNFLCYGFQIGGRSPHRIVFSKKTGRLFQVDFQISYDEQGLIPNDESVPFRLTRNLQTFFTPFGVEGTFLASFASAAEACQQAKDGFDSFLHLFLRDEIMAWAHRRTMVQDFDLSEGSLNQIVRDSADNIWKRVKVCLPQAGSCPEDSHEHGQEKVIELVQNATDPSKLCRMDPTWHPWF
eukprot:scaffold587_cov339-Pavlova_lutheri.AAC.11